MLLPNRNWRDVVGGLLLAGLGLFMVLYAATHYGLGTFARMRPGMFPVLFGSLLVLLGGAIVVGALIRLMWRGDNPAAERIEWSALRSPAAVIASIVVFAVMVPYLGIIPAIFALTAINALGDGRLGVLGVLVVSSVLSVLIIAIFGYGLGLNVPFVRWDFG